MIKFTSLPTKNLSESLNPSDTRFRLNNIKGWDGNDLTPADFSTLGFGVFRNSVNSKLEFFSFDPTTIANGEIDIIKRGLSPDGDFDTEVAENKLSWTKGDTYVDLGAATPQMLEWLKQYIDGIAIGGAPLATDTITGLAKLSVAAADPSNPIAMADNDPRVLTSDEKDALAGGGDLGTPDSGNKFVTEDGFAYLLGIFGDGSDGDVTISSATTLSRDMYYNNLTVNSTLTTNGFKIYVKGKLDGTGTIKYPQGNAGGNGVRVGGAGADGFSGSGYGLLLNTPGSGGGGGNGAKGGAGGTSPYGNGNAGYDSAASNGYPGGNAANRMLGTDNNTAGAGAKGSGGGSLLDGGAGGGGGSEISLSPITNKENLLTVYELIQAQPLEFRMRRIAGAAGGGGGGKGSGHEGGGGGGGGASGGIIFICAFEWAGSFTFEAKGGNGGAGGNGVNGNGGAGGGGCGGHGGYVLSIYHKKTWTGTATLTGGTGGVKGTGGTGGSAGSNGANGAVIELQI